MDKTGNKRLGWLVLAALVAFLTLQLSVSISTNTEVTERPQVSLSRKVTPPLAPQGLSKRSPASQSLTNSTAEEIVAGKVRQFVKKRRDLMRAIAVREGKEVPREIEEFFDALEAGNWNDIEARWKVLAAKSGQFEGSTHAPELDPFWPAVLDAYGVAEQAHLWPAQKLLDYGNSILDSLKPGMIYVGGTDAGRWVPELLNETRDGEQHIIVTQNALADSRYVDFMNTLYGDRMSPITSDDSKRAFEEYTSDARRRYEHDIEFPDEPKQVRPGEDIRIVDGKVSVSGQVAVMTINERLLQILMEKNPDVGFALQQSYPLKSTYAEAIPNGPIMELRAQENFTPERANQVVDYWRNTATQLTSDPQAALSEEVRSSYAKLATSQGMLLLERNFVTEAEQTFRTAIELAPANSEALFNYINLLASQGRSSEAIPIVENAARQNRENQQFRDLLRQLRSQTGR